MNSKASASVLQPGRETRVSSLFPKNWLLVCLTIGINVFSGAVLMEKGLFICPEFIQCIFKMMGTDFIEMPGVPYAFPGQSLEPALWEGV